MQLTNVSDAGFTFTIQGNDPTVVGNSGGGLGYGGVGSSAAIEFNLAGGVSQTGLGKNGTVATPTDLTSAGIDLHSEDLLQVHLSYDGATLSVTEKDLAASASATQNYSVNLVSLTGGSDAYMGFTAGTGAGGMNATVNGFDYNDTTNVPGMGINIRRLGFDSGDELFADAMKEPGTWSTNLVDPSNNVATPPPSRPLTPMGGLTPIPGLRLSRTPAMMGAPTPSPLLARPMVAPIPS